MPSCSKQSPIPYIFATSCGHTKPVTCDELVLFNANPTMTKCDEDEVYDSPCGHSKPIKCWKKTRILDKNEVFVCDKKRSMNLPRCGHKQKVPCSTAERIDEWSGVSCEVVGVIKEGVSYGMQDHPCHDKAVLQRICGHTLMLPCSEAFAKLRSLDSCREPVTALHPSCGHACQITCKLAADLKDQNVNSPEVPDRVKEGEVPPRAIFRGIPKCNAKVNYVRKCGHVEQLSCSEVLAPKHGCRVESTTKSPICGHDINIPCFLKPEIEQIQQNHSGFIPSIFNAATRLATVVGLVAPKDISTLSNDARKAIASCALESNITLSCGHDTVVKCAKLPSLSEKKGVETNNCQKKIEVCLPCGHNAEMTCNHSRLYKQGLLDVKCIGKKQVKCWNYSHCSSNLEVDCSFDGIAACANVTSWTCPSKAHEYKLSICSKGKPQDCPECSLQKLSLLISDPKEFTGEHDLVCWLEGTVPKDRIKWISRGKLDFIANEAALLKYYRGYYMKQDPWKRPLFKSHRVPCFRVLSRENQNLDSFDPSKFVKQQRTLYGMILTILNKRNIQKICSDESNKPLTLLLGFTSSIKVKQLSSNPLSGGVKEKTKLYENISREGYDTLAYNDGKGIEKIIVWDPFACIALCVLTLNRSQLTSLAERMGEVPPQDFEPNYVSYQNPPDNILITSKVVKPVPSDSDDDDDESFDMEEEDKKKATARLQGTILEGLVLDCSWIGGINSRGAIPPSLEKELMGKMQFVNSEASPFSAITQLRSLLEQADVAIFHLLMAAEMITHSPDEATKSLNCYLSHPQTVKLHPWALVIAARLPGTSFSSNLISTFVEFFPAQCQILSTTEMDSYEESDDDDDNNAEVDGLLKQDWKDIKIKYAGEVESEATDELLGMIGLRKVKEEVICIWKSELLIKRMDSDARKENQVTANYVFLGNPGVGKTTVARLFSRILCDAGVRKSHEIVETTAQKSKDDGSDEFRKLTKKAIGGGGVLFMDEAYDLDPVSDFKGRPIVNELLTLCEDHRDKISVILAGYEDDFQKKFFAYNVGLKSRFKEIIFEDFDEKELSVIWTEARTRKMWKEEEGVCSVATRRLLKKSGKKGFGNARDVRRLLESAVNNALARQDENFSPDDMILEIRDVIGEDPRLKNEKLHRLLGEINEKIGWKRVKERVSELIDLCGRNYHQELMGKPPFEIFLNRMFLGNPGTGKTTAAKIYGRLLKELGFLSNGDVVSKSASDFIGSHVGESQKNTLQILEAAAGKVLLIDEAYALDDSLYGKQVLDTLVEKVQGAPSDDIAVLLLGYEDEMLKMLREQNPGLSRRFPKEHAFYFDDYSDNELLAILDLNTKQQEVSSTIEFKEKALKILRLQKRQANFGNAGAVELVLKGALQRASKRSNESVICLQDIDIEDPGACRASKMDDPLSLLDDLYRMEKIKEKLQQLQKSWSVERREGGDNLELGHFVFLGSPGTGKTTVGRVIADVLFGLDLMPSSKFIETSALDLTGDYVGQTKTKVGNILKEGKGGIVFIDEAYNLGQGQFGKEAVDTLVAAMTSESFQDTLIVIAGYPSEINSMLNTNAGLKSRFTHFFQFPDWTPDDCESFFVSLASKEGFEPGADVLEVLKEGCSRLIQLKGWANGRDVKKIWTHSKAQRAERVYDEPELVKKMSAHDLSAAINSIVQARIGKLSNFDPDADPLAKLDSLFRMDAIKSKLQTLRKTWDVEKREGNGVPNLGHFVFTGNPGTGKTTVARVIAEVLFGLQLKASDKIIERSALDLIADYVGQTSTKVTEALQEAKGGILFIDEAYNLGEGLFGKEACDTIVAAMTSEEYQNVHIVIAGYPKEIDDMFRTNAGLKSRFTHFFEFPDWTAVDCVSFFGLCAQKENFSPLGDGDAKELQRGFEQLVTFEGWANGRDVKRVWEEAKSHRASRVYDKPEIQKTMLISDLQNAITTMIKTRQPKPCIRKSFKPQIAQPKPQSHVTPLKQPLPGSRTYHAHVEESLTEEAIEKEECTIEKENSDEDIKQSEHEAKENENYSGSVSDLDDGPVRDAGVTDKIWFELDCSKKHDREENEMLARMIEEQDEITRQESTRDEVMKRLQEEMQRKMEELAHLKSEEEAMRKREDEAQQIAEEMRREEELARLKAEVEELRRREDEAQKIVKALRLKEQIENQRRHEAEIRRKQLEAEEIAIQKQEEIKRHLRQISPCPAGFNWHRVCDGWRCAGGSHFVSNDELQKNFGYDV